MMSDIIYAVFILNEKDGLKQWCDETGFPRVFGCQEAAEERARAEGEKGHSAYAGKLWPMEMLVQKR